MHTWQVALLLTGYSGLWPAVLLAKVAYTEGYSMVWIGLLFHFIIAVSWTLLFFIAFAKMKLLKHSKILVGMAYGVFIWVMMNFEVIPLSSIGARPFQFTGTIIMIMIQMIVIGIPISFFANNYYKVNNY